MVSQGPEDRFPRHIRVNIFTEFLTEICGEIKKYGPTWLGWFGPSAMLFVSDPQLNQELLTSPATIQKNRVTKDVLGEILGDGLLALDGSDFKTII